MSSVIANCVFKDNDGYHYSYLVPENLEYKIRSGQYVVVESPDYQVVPYAVCRVTSYDTNPSAEMKKTAKKYIVAICENDEVEKAHAHKEDIANFVKMCSELSEKYHGIFDTSVDCDTLGNPSRMTFTLTIDAQ